MGFRFPHLTGACRIAGAASRNRLLYRSLLPLVPSAETESDQFRTSRRWHGGHSHHHEGEREKGSESDGVLKLGLAADMALAVGKAVTGYVSGSTAVIADAAHSVSDVVLSGVALWSFRASRVPKDKNHPYGHGKFESLGALGISCMLMVTAGGIAWHAIAILQGQLTSNPDMIYHSLRHFNDSVPVHVGNNHAIDLKYPALALGMTITSIFIKEGLYWITKQAGDKEGSGLMMANAWHHRADAISSIVALVGVGGAILGAPFLDPLAGLIVSGMILKAGIESGYDSAMELVDAGLPLPILDAIKQTILEVEGVLGCHRLRGRKAGSSLYLDVHIEVDPFLTVSSAHDIGETVRHQIQRHHPDVLEVFIHIDPSYSKFSGARSDQKKNPMRIKWKEQFFFRKRNVTDLAHDVFSTQFSEKMLVEQITCHSLQGKVYLQIQVSMTSDMLLKHCRRNRKMILKADSDICNVCILLNLGKPILHRS